MNEEEQFEYAQWILERNLHWVSAAEVKTGVVVTLAVAMLGALAAAFTQGKVSDHTSWAILLSSAAAFCLFAALFCAAMSIFPRTEGPKRSFVFFGKIVSDSRADYADAFMHADRSAFLQDCLDQIHRNAEIARDKFKWVRCAMGWSFVGVMPWVAAIAFLLANGSPHGTG